MSVRLRFTLGMQRIAPPLGYLQLLALLVCAGCGWMARNDNADGVVLYQQGNYQGGVRIASIIWGPLTISRPNYLGVPPIYRLLNNTIIFVLLVILITKHASGD